MKGAVSGVKATASRPRRGRPPREVPLFKVQVVLGEGHIEALNTEAARRARLDPEKGHKAFRPDRSLVLREVLDAWIAKGGK